MAAALLFLLDFFPFEDSPLLLVVRSPPPKLKLDVLEGDGNGDEIGGKASGESEKDPFLASAAGDDRCELSGCVRVD